MKLEFNALWIAITGKLKLCSGSGCYEPWAKTLFETLLLSTNMLPRNQSDFSELIVQVYAWHQQALHYRTPPNAEIPVHMLDLFVKVLNAGNSVPEVGFQRMHSTTEHQGPRAVQCRAPVVCQTAGSATIDFFVSRFVVFLRL